VRLYIFGGLILLVLGGLAVAAAHVARRGERSRPALMNIALAAAFAAIVVVTVRPSGSGAHELRLRPFEDIRLAVPPPVHRGWIAEIVGNVLLFAPLGVVLCLRHMSLRRSILAAAALSVAVELVQLALPGRTTAVDDVLCNTTGAALGWLVASLVHRPVPARSPATGESDDFVR
jgi:glycopeptide antibiotics resistance protein